MRYLYVPGCLQQAELLNVFAPACYAVGWGSEDVTCIPCRHMAVQAAALYAYRHTALHHNQNCVQGVMMLPASSLPAQGADTVYKRLWVHEVFRVFYDRLVDDSDRVWLLQQVCLHSSDMLTSYTPGHNDSCRVEAQDLCCNASNLILPRS